MTQQFHLYMYSIEMYSHISQKNENSRKYQNVHRKSRHNSPKLETTLTVEGINKFKYIPTMDYCKTMLCNIVTISHMCLLKFMSIKTK